MSIMATLTAKCEKFMSSYPMAVKVYNLYYKKIVHTEVKLAKITANDKVLCIGGGSFPSTALEIANMTGAYVNVIDNDLIAVRKAQNLIEKVGYNNKINVNHANGAKIDSIGYSVIHIAQQVVPKNDVIENIWKNADLNARILIRTPSNKLEKLYPAFNKNKWLNKRNKISENYKFINSTLMLEKLEEEHNNQKNRNNMKSYNPKPSYIFG
ncbi:hypothetical protein SYNTR_0809 [Candidatus Syntrophocurvum alkaliphilum]|uniref:Nicotianamine synthase protein n=1 Tax=Candidatus Syntrophocurvum alkaliphilum TaxID=2293317 RepID=A0A6I6DEF1_9FIRM|nr:hypothetical protein [Candidatus Syntrophocurvum alkaliphilum]QGT99402.1 hypothetical protein SYNTR_0809 [Candidatus Syntrophocurvum alkaliphilum]